MDLIDHAFGIHGQALEIRGQRLDLLASNIANAATPGYRARDLDFRAALVELGTSVFSSAAAVLLRTVAKAVADVSNTLTVRGHTDALAYARGGINNWTLSTARADATRRALADAGVESGRFRRIEGVADTDPYNPKDADDPRNRRISVTLMYKDGEAPPST